MAGFVLVATCGCAVRRQPEGPAWMHVSDDGAPTVWSSTKDAGDARRHVPGASIRTLSEWNSGNVGDLLCGWHQ